MRKWFSVISNLAIRTWIAVDYSRVDFFLTGIFQFKELTKSASGSKNNIKLTKWHIFVSTVRLKSALKLKEDLPEQDNMYTNCSFGTVKLTLILANTLPKKFLKHKSIRLFG